MASELFYKYMKGFFLIVVVMTLYSRSMHYGYNWDDADNVTHNAAIKTTEGLINIWIKPGTTYQYYPIVFTSFWAEYNILGLNPHFSHFINALLHGLNSLLLWLILRRLSMPGAWTAALIFALHPVHVESVAWITERKNVLSGFFYLSSILTYLYFMTFANRFQYFPSTSQSNFALQNKNKLQIRFYLISLCLFCFALLSKTTTCILPAVILILLWWKNKRIGWFDIKSIFPFFLLSTIFSLNTIVMEKNLGAQGIEWSNTFTEKCLIAGRAIWFYAGKLIWPQNICFMYPKWQIDTGDWQQYLYPFFIICVIIFLWIARNQFGKGPLASVLIFCGTLFPALGFFNVFFHRYSYVQDHFQYLASMALIALFAATLSSIFNKLKIQKLYSFCIVHFLIIAILGTLVWTEQYKYKDEETLYHDTLAKNPNAALAHNNLGKILYTKGSETEAMEHYTKALTIKPDFAETYYNIGIILGNNGKFDEAIRYYRKALQIIPYYAKAYNNIGVILMKQGNTDRAISQYRMALNINHQFAETHNNLAAALEKKGDIQGAIKHYTKAISINPNHADAHNNLGTVLAKQNRSLTAINHFLKALKIKPDFPEAHNNIGLSLSKIGKHNQAVKHYTKALSIKPDYIEAHNNIATVFYYLDRIDAAIFHFQEALRLEPENTIVRANLSKLLEIKNEKESK
jgi:protein O-mannosyl-transferase